jgi:predicted ATPase
MHINKISINQNRFPTSEAYPFNLSIFQNTKTLDLTKPVTFFIGENGTGKSTLLKSMCSKCKIYIWEGVSRVRDDTISWAIDHGLFQINVSEERTILSG